eukprot:TRINITY_DN1739_c1_g1_i4.p2 TRINITY_DN1739_c1_g1~~TRINITY_DN1739_c1_g1_i4.p2  ORF type:complete len:145 (-),score=6.21 TRINITY_DN1739_c1_g1_i4:23-457(-)
MHPWQSSDPLDRQHMVSLDVLSSDWLNRLYTLFGQHSTQILVDTLYILLLRLQNIGWLDMLHTPWLVWSRTHSPDTVYRSSLLHSARTLANSTYTWMHPWQSSDPLDRQHMVSLDVLSSDWLNRLYTLFAVHSAQILVDTLYIL